MKTDHNMPENKSEMLKKNVADQIKPLSGMESDESKYNSIFQYTNEAILLAQDEYFRFPNPAALSLFDCTEEQLTARPLSEFIHPDHRALVTSRHLQRIKGKSFPSVYSFKILTGRAVVKWIELKVVVIDWEGHPATLCFMTDITERKMIEKRLEEKTRELELQTQQLKVLHEATVELTRHLDLETLLFTILNQAAELVGSDHDAVAVVGQDN